MKNLTRKLQHYLAAGVFLAVLLAVCILGKNKTEVQAAGNLPYYIKVNRQMSTVTIYEKDEKGKYTVPVKAMLCSAGYATPTGTFQTPEKYRWRLLMDDVWGQYSTRIYGGILFHSVWYYEKDPSTLSNKQFNKLGTICSHGCVRLNVEDAKWIYDNCPIGTSVTIYDSSDPGPLGKPEGIKVSEKTKMGYDPTDIWSPDNPYLKAHPVISGAKNQTISYGKKVNLTKGVTAVTSTGEDITDEIAVTIKYKDKVVEAINTKKTGEYYVTYKVIDKLGKKAEKEVVYTVIDDVVPKAYRVGKVFINEKITRETALGKVVIKWHGKAVDSDEIKVKWSTISNSNRVRKYKVTYTYTAPNGKTVKATTKAYYDKEAPVITGVEDRTFVMEEQLNNEFFLEGITVSDSFDKLTIEDIEVISEKQEDGSYKVTYRVDDRGGNITEAQAVYKVAEEVTIVCAADRVITPDQVVDTAFAKEGVKAYESGKDITEHMIITISQGMDFYEITYRVQGMTTGMSDTKTVVFTVEKPAEEEGTEETSTEDTVTEEIGTEEIGTEEIDSEKMEEENSNSSDEQGSTESSLENPVV